MSIVQPREEGQNCFLDTCRNYLWAVCDVVFVRFCVVPRNSVFVGGQYSYWPLYLHFCCCCLFQDSHSSYCPLLLVSFNFYVYCMQLIVRLLLLLLFATPSSDVVVDFNL